MIQELLVLLACTQKSGCTQTSTLYYAQHPEITNIIEEKEDKLSTLMNISPKLIVYIAPIIIYTTKGQASFRLSKYFSLQISNELYKVSFRYDF